VNVPPATRKAVAAFALGLACLWPKAADAAPWLFVSDVHLNPLSTSADPSPLGEDTNEALLRSALAEMKRVDPAPPVVVIPGDFLGHHFVGRYAKATMAHLAQSFGRTFPDAQFVLALGNEDSACGDYVLAPDAPFLRDTAAAWEPLVNRHGEAPDFLKTFPHDGFYTAKLPVPGLRAVVLDDVFWSPLFRAACGSTGIDGAAQEVSELDRALPRGNRDKAWVLLHIPPGVDAYSTVHVVHHLAIVPFLDSVPRNRLLAILGDEQRHVALAIAGHTHKFAFRLVDADDSSPVPVLLVPGLSPILRNAPMFLTVDVGTDGTPRGIEVHAFADGVWRDLGGSKDLGLREFSGPALAQLRRRLESDPELRSVFTRLYDGGAPSEITTGNWRGYWCAIGSMSGTDYRLCEGQRGYGFLTQRGLFVGALIALAVLLAVAFGATFLVRSALRRR
jgi:hypothetical protein